MAEKLIFTLLAVFLSAFGFDSAFAQPVKVDSVEAELVADTPTVASGRSFRVGLRIRHDPHWHTYWRNPGDSGLPTVIDLTLPEGYSAGAIEWPAPQRLPVGPLTNFGYEGEIVLPIIVRPPAMLAAGPQKFSAHAQWLVCKDVCIPGEARLTLTLPAAAGSTAGGAPSSASSKWASLFESMAARTPSRVEHWRADVIQGAAAPQLLLVPAAASNGAANNNTAARSERVEFFPYKSELIENSAPQPWLEGQLAGTVTRALEVTLVAGMDRSKLQAAGLFSEPAGVLVRDGQPVEIQLAAADFAAQWQRPAQAAVVRPDVSRPDSARVDAPKSSRSQGNTAAANATMGMSLWLALLFAAAGGLILNLMPCVFPVVGLKVLGFMQSAQGSRSQTLHHALLFVAGVLLSFIALALLLWGLRAAGEAIGWGFQLQSPWFVMLMALLFIGIGLNLSGLYEFGLTLTRVGGAAAAQPSALSSMAAGVLAVIVATPCTAPFMASALGYTLSQPLWVSVLVFGAMGVGMSLPYLALGAFPGWMRWLPKPGRWMESLRQLLAFPMYATALWLAWVLVQQAGIDALLVLGAAAICLAIAAWIYGRFVQPPGSARAVALMWMAVSVLAGLWAMTQLDVAPASGLASISAGPSAAGTVAAAPGDTSSSDRTRSNWQPWSPEAVDRAVKQGRTVFVDFTAAWCVSCQANKKLVLDRPVVINELRQRNVLLLRADWTSRDPRITEALASFGRNGVPLYLVYTPDRREPRILPELLTVQAVIDGLTSSR